MNREAMYLGLQHSNFNSAHGMHHDKNYSSALDIARVSFQCMKKPKFRQIVSNEKYSCESRLNLGYIYHWKNTNKLLELGYSGLKTGITPTAGPCLAACINSQEHKYIVVLLCSRTMENRWTEVPRLV